MSEHPLPPEQIGSFKRLSPLGSGTFGQVWLVEEIGGNQYAAKIFKVGSKEATELRAESDVWQKIQYHPNVLGFRGPVVFGDWVLLLSTYISGGTLRNWIDTRASASTFEIALHMAAGLLNGVRHLHSHEPPIIHGDIKPGNILLDRLVPIIADFGQARSGIQETQPNRNPGTGTRAYMAPESRGGRRDQRTDLWAVGIILCELLTQKHPYPHRDSENFCITSSGHDPSVIDPLPAPLRSLVLKAIDPDPGARYQSAADLLADVQNLQREYPPPAQEPTVHSPPVAQPSPPPVRTVPMGELGPFLEYYANILGLEPSEVATRFCGWAGASVQWPADLHEPEEVAEFLTTRLYRGSEQDVPLAHLSRLLGAFADAENSADVPRLMAEWLCAEAISDKPFIQLPFAEFESPSADLGRTYGTRCRYQNARHRLPGMGCAFVHFELEANTKSPEAVTVSGEPYTRVTELLRHLHDETITDPVTGVPHSHAHVHPGDELIYVLDGTIFVELDNTGLWTPVLAGDYIHFNAEIPHAVWNVSSDKPAKAVIIRFFQLSRQGTRNGQVATLREIQELMGRMGQPVVPPNVPLNKFQQMRAGFESWSAHTEQSYYLWTAIAPWVHDRTRPPQGRLKEADKSNQVQDLVGLSQFLRAYVENLPDRYPNPTLLELRGAYRAFSRAAHAPVSEAGALSDSNKRLNDPISCLFELNRQIEQFITTNAPERREQWRTCFHGIPRGSKHVPTAEDLEQLAQKLSLPPVLLQGYLSPNALRVVVVRDAKTPPQGARDGVRAPFGTAGGEGARDWVRAPFGAAGGVGRRATYYLPSRSLANSDLSIVLLTLPRDSSTSWNSHPGFELVLPLAGEVSVSFCEQRAGEPFVTPNESSQPTTITPPCGVVSQFGAFFREPGSSARFRSHHPAAIHQFDQPLERPHFLDHAGLERGRHPQ